jgi:hypothetical protein
MKVAVQAAINSNPAGERVKNHLLTACAVMLLTAVTQTAQAYFTCQVDSLTGYTEHIDNQAYTATYAELSLVENWFEGQKKVLVRLAGGPTDQGGVTLWDIALKVGEKVAVLGFVKARDINRGYLTINPLHLFHQRPDDGGYTNGQLFSRRVVTADQLGRLVKGLTGRKLADACPYDEMPDVRRKEPTPQGGQTGPTPVVTAATGGPDAGT